MTATVVLSPYRPDQPLKPDTLDVTSGVARLPAELLRTETPVFDSLHTEWTARSHGVGASLFPSTHPTRASDTW